MATKPSKATKARKASAAEPQARRSAARPAPRKPAAPAKREAARPAPSAPRTKASVAPARPAPPKRAEPPTKRAAPPKPPPRAAKVGPPAKAKPEPGVKPARPAKPKKVPRAAAQRRHVHFRALLSEVRRGLLRSYSAAKGESRADLPSGTEDYIDYAVSSYTREFTLSLTEMERQRLRLVEEALGRLDRGEYGRCLQCGNEIPPARLEVEPWARHCVRCQELEEQGLLERREPGYGDDDEVEAEEEVESEVVTADSEGLDDEAEPEEVIEDEVDRGVEDDEL